MPVTITIGQAVWNTEFIPPDWDIERDNHPDAPTFPNDASLEPKSNWRYINVPVWLAFGQECGIADWLEALLAPGQAKGLRALSAEDYRIVNEAYLLRSTFAEGQAGWDFEPSDEEQALIGTLTLQHSHDEYLARLIWLRFWIRWALDHCEQPALQIAW